MKTNENGKYFTKFDFFEKKCKVRRNFALPFLCKKIV